MGRIKAATRVLRWGRGTGEDALVEERARSALAVAFGGAADGVTLRVYGGLLTIRGEVEELDDIRLYESVVRRVPGVLEVDNLLRLRLAGRIRPFVLTGNTAAR